MLYCDSIFLHNVVSQHFFKTLEAYMGMAMWPVKLSWDWKAQPLWAVAQCWGIDAKYASHCCTVALATQWSTRACTSLNKNPHPTIGYLLKWEFRMHVCGGWSSKPWAWRDLAWGPFHSKKIGCERLALWALLRLSCQMDTYLKGLIITFHIGFEVVRLA